MGRELYNIATVNGVSQRYGKPITIQGEKCFIFRDYDEIGSIIWNISHMETGCIVCEKPIKKEAISIATELLKENPTAIEKGRQMLLEKGFELPLNKLA